jgi:acyl-CoA thioesterase-1
MSIDNAGSNYTIVVAGDSISEGIIYDEKKEKYTILSANYVNLLKSTINGYIKNISKFGDTLLKGAQKLREYLSKNKSDVVIIEFGGNDCDFYWEEISKNPNGNHKPKTDIDIFKEKLNELIKFLNFSHIISILMTLPPLNANNYFKWISKNNEEVGKNILEWLGSIDKIYLWQEKYSFAIADVAKETNTKLIDIRNAFLNYSDFKQLICIDGIHPNAKGHEIIAKEVYKCLKNNYEYLTMAM